MFALFSCCGPRKKTEPKTVSERTPLLEDASASAPAPSPSPEPTRNPQDELAAKWAAVAATGERSLTAMNSHLLRSPSLRSQSLHSEDTSVAGGLSPVPPRGGTALPNVHDDVKHERTPSLHPEVASLPPLSPAPSADSPDRKTSKKKKSSSRFKPPTEW